MELKLARLKLMTRHLSLFIILVVIAPGTVTPLLEEERKSSFLTAAVGDSVVFNCQIDFPQHVEIQYALEWNKDGQKVFSINDGVLTTGEVYRGRVKQLPAESVYGKGSINLTSIRESDAGWYECRVVFRNRDPRTRLNGTWFHLTVDGGTLLAIPPINQTTLEGESAHFPCVTKDRSSIVNWYKDNIAISDLPELVLRSFVEAEGSLTISPTSMEDLGEYTCEVTDRIGEKQSVSAFLNVQYKAKVIYVSREIYLPYGRPGLLDCNFRANPPLTNLRWEKDGFLFDPYNVQGVFYRRNGSLYFSKVDESHGGLYTCTPFNELGTEGPSPTMNVIVQKPPVFTTTPHNLYLRRRGDSVDMPCDAMDGNSRHKPNIIWLKKDGSPLPRGRTKLENGNLTIENIEEDDRGVYQCIASNEAATISVESELMIENVAPRAPYNLSANTTKDTIIVSWLSGYTKPPMTFSVWYRVVDSNQWLTLPVTSRGVGEVTIKNLPPGKEYEIMVLSQDKHGDGMFSKVVKTRTKGTEEDWKATAQKYQGVVNTSESEADDAHCGPPGDFDVSLVTDGFLVSWSPPTSGTQHLQQYVVTWSEGTFDVVIGRVETSKNSYLVTDLEEDQSYVFQVFSVSRTGAETGSSKFLVHVPSYRKVRAVSLGLGLGLILLLILLAVAWYAKRIYQNKKIQDSRKGERLSIST